MRAPAEYLKLRNLWQRLPDRALSENALYEQIIAARNLRPGDFATARAVASDLVAGGAIVREPQGAYRKAPEFPEFENRSPGTPAYNAELARLAAEERERRERAERQSEENRKRLQASAEAAETRFLNERIDARLRELGLLPQTTDSQIGGSVERAMVAQES